MGSLMQGAQDASGLMFRRNRYYDPPSGRFTQQDPIGLAGGLNGYGFAEGDPVTYSDPFGLCPWWMGTGAICEAHDAYQAGGVLGVVDLTVGIAPGVGDWHDGISAVTGRNWVTGEQLGAGGRGASVIAAVVPFVSSRTLRNRVDDIYKGARGRNVIGTGSTADAIREETRTGRMVGGTFHLSKGQQYMSALRNWLRDNPNASERDALVARSVLNDLRDAVNEALRAGRTR
jgi:RHS repeat-associated protein